MALLYLAAAAILAAASFLAILRAHADRELLETGEARWIWYTREVPKPQWLRFYATRDFEVPAVPPRAVAKVFGDRRHALWVNGLRLGGGEQKPGDPLILHDLTPHLRPGANRITVLVESNTGAGGLLVAVDMAGVGRNALVSDASWRVDPSPDAVEKGGRFPAAVWGRPPMHPWGYPRMPRPR